VGAATYAAKTAKIPAIAFSGVTGDPTAWNAPTPLHSKVYADLALNVTTTIINTGLLSQRDAEWCGSTRLPWEADVILLRGSSCYVTISPGDANDKTTINDAAVQQQIINKLKPILSCLP
jgi:hypothetical protein